MRMRASRGVPEGDEMPWFKWKGCISLCQVVRSHGSWFR